MKPGKKRKLNIPRVIMAGAGLVTLTIIGILGLVLSAAKRGLPEQQLARRWSEKNDFAQNTILISPTQEVHPDTINALRYEIESLYKEKNTEASFHPEEGNPNLIDAYAAFTHVMLSTDRGSGTYDAVAVGGDFFLFHPVRLISGNYFSESDRLQDYVLLDEEAAWDLFGSPDVAGMKVHFGEMDLVVAGVYERKQGKIDNLAAGGNEPRVFISYRMAEEAGLEPGISVYELLSPNPIPQFANSLIKEIKVFPSDDLVYVENSARFSYKHYYDLLGQRKSREMRLDDIPYPYWENVARYREGRLMYVALWQWILAGALFLAVFINLMWFVTTHKLTKESFEKFADKMDEKRRAKKTKQIKLGEDREFVDELEPIDDTESIRYVDPESNKNKKTVPDAIADEPIADVTPIGATEEVSGAVTGEMQDGVTEETTVEEPDTINYEYEEDESYEG
ncbi:MAG: ABC transporter permease [Lachnospiraceae bacterium]|nr:ABC transporter permease [Lachnospiraceae bacterium]